MKTKVLIIEDNFSKFFSTKAILESQLKLEVQAMDVESSQEMVERTAALAPDMVMIRPEGGVTELLLKLQKRRSNRRNTEIVLMLTQDFDDEVIRRFAALVTEARSPVADAA